MKTNYSFLLKSKKTRRYSNAKDAYLMLGCADNDYVISDALQNDLVECIKESEFGYAYRDQEMLEALNYFYGKHYNLKFSEENVIFGLGVVHLLQNAMQVVTKPWDGVIIQTPCYYPFFEIIHNLNRRVIDNSLIYNVDQGTYDLNFDLLEKQMALPYVNAFILCSPHNPTGRIWKPWELKKLADLCLRHCVYLLSDDVWSQNMMFNNEFYSLLPYAKSNPYLFIVNSPSKALNFGAGSIGYGISYYKNLILKFKKRIVSDYKWASTNRFSAKFLQSAYTNEKNWEWTKQICQLVTKNFIKVCESLEKNTKIKVIRSEATYVLWLDFSNCDVKNEDELTERLNKQKICGEPGSEFFKTTDNLFYRFVIGISEENIDLFCKRLIAEFKC